MELKYVGFYDHISNESQSRGYALPAASKMEYIAGVLSRLGNSVLIVSPSATSANQSSPGHIQQIMPGVKVKLFATWRSGHKVRRVLSVLRSRLSLLGYLLTHTSPGRMVYAGTFDPRKGGAAAAAAAAAYLDANFEVNILGFGSAEDVENMKRAVEEADSAGGARVRYHGVLKGEEYSEFLKTCEIGLSTQNPAARFNETSFPSKILSYMAHGLKVVSIHIPAIEKSGVGADITYYERQEPREIAEAIRRAALSQDASGGEVLRRLDEDFTRQLDRLLLSVQSGAQGKGAGKGAVQRSERHSDVD